MSFREKLYWARLFVIVLCWGYYFVSFGLAAQGAALDVPAYQSLFFKMGMLSVFLSLGVAATLVAYDRKSAPRTEDERDRAIEQHSVRISYYILIAGCFLVMTLLFTGFDGFMTFNILLAVVVIAELIRASLNLVGYRRGY
jgi:heme/copper-type cytochrome/quinol oxidase subunit 2